MSAPHPSGNQTYVPLAFGFLAFGFLAFGFLAFGFLAFGFLALDVLPLSVAGVVGFETPARGVEGGFAVPTGFRSPATVRSATARRRPIPLTCARLAGSALAIDSIVVSPASTRSCDVAGPMPGRSVSGVVTWWVSAQR